MERRDLFLTLAGGGLLAALHPQSARAQTINFIKVQPPVEAPPEKPAEKADGKFPLSRVLAEIGERAGVLVVADSTTADERANMPPKDATITSRNVDEFIAAAIKDLEEGIVWARFNLPPPPKGKKWSGEDVSAYAMGLMRLYGSVGGDGPEGTVEVIAQHVAAEQATPIFTTLGLQPVYLVTRRTGKPTFQGKWEASYGIMSLKVESSGRVRGSYVTNQGSIDGRIVRGVLEFHWFEAGANSGGTGRFFLAEDGESFTGIWWNDGEDLSANGRTWTGKRISYKP